MLHVVLYQPEIPPNTGNVIRLCANSGAHLHLVGPLGFTLDDSRLRRAGLDYQELTNVEQYLNWEHFLQQSRIRNLWAFSTRGKRRYTDALFGDGDGLLFGPETRGLPEDLLDRFDDHVLRLPMQNTSRSLNLSNTVAIGLYEALRQIDFAGLA